MTLEGKGSTCFKELRGFNSRRVTLDHDCKVTLDLAMMILGTLRESLPVDKLVVITL